MIETSYIAVFIVGLLGGVHCVGMCGGIVGALTLGLSKQPHHSAYWMLPYLVAYNAGRISSYVMAGMLVAGISWLSGHLFALHSLQQGLEIVAAIFMLALGLYIAGWWRGLLQVEKLGALMIWKPLEPLGRKVMPVMSTRQAFLLGLVWGWLPCGLVYSVLIMTITVETPIEGGLLMLSFGLGTLPNLFLMGVFSSAINHFMGQPWVKQVAGALIIAFAISMFYRAMQ